VGIGKSGQTQQQCSSSSIVSVCARHSTRESLGRSNIGVLHSLCSVCLTKNRQMHTISAATILHLALASSMLRRGGPAQCLPIATVCCMDWHV
jgi:hypothetical protein